MKEHTKLYFKHFGYDIEDFVPSEISGKPTNDIHHIESRGMGGTKREEDINNLMAVTRYEHDKLGDITAYKDWLHEVHQSFLETRTPWIELYPDCEVLEMLYGKYLANKIR